jgi:hypothetical protein
MDHQMHHWQFTSSIISAQEPRVLYPFTSVPSASSQNKIKKNNKKKFVFFSLCRLPLKTSNACCVFSYKKFQPSQNKREERTVFRLNGMDDDHSVLAFSFSTTIIIVIAAEKQKKSKTRKRFASTLQLRE